MLYYKCPVCRTVLANKQIPFEERIKKICQDDSLSFKQKKLAKQKILDELQVIRICCRSSVLTYVREIEIII